MTGPTATSRALLGKISTLTTSTCSTLRVWAAVSRALRSPSRIDRELFAPAQPPYFLAGGPGFHSEEELAYELGYRHQRGALALSVATFYSRYHGLRSVERATPTSPLVIGNGQDGESYGAEVTAQYWLTSRWHVCAGCTGCLARLPRVVAPSVACTGRTHVASDRAAHPSGEAVASLGQAWGVGAAARRAAPGGRPRVGGADRAGLGIPIEGCLPLQLRAIRRLAGRHVFRRRHAGGHRRPRGGSVRERAGPDGAR